MSSDLAERRRSLTLTLFLVAAALIGVAAVTLGIELRAAHPNAASGPALPGLAENIRNGQRITVTSAEATYRIERAERGAETVWVVRDRDDYPVSAARLAQLTRGLEQLRLTRRMTSDPSKYERLGVTDPRQGGRGVLVQIENSQRALLVDVILGIEPGGAIYVRRPDEAQTWAAEGELPPLRDVATWMDLRPLTLDPENLARVEIQPPASRAYILARDARDQAWRIASPALTPLSHNLVADTAVRITELDPVDVRTAPAIQGAAQARLRATTFDGVTIEAELIRSDDRTWVKLVARADAPELEAQALAINNVAAAWAYALRDGDANALAPPLSTLVPGVN